MKLTNIQIKNAKPIDRTYKLSDGDNLYLAVNPNGSKYWRMVYRFNNKRKQIAFGKYPVISLQDAREMRLESQKMLIKGVDLVEVRRQKKLEHKMKYENNFEAIAREWHENKKHTWQPKHAENILNRLATHIFPIVGSKPITEIKPPELLYALRAIEETGKHEMAHRMLQTSSQIFRYAVATGKAEFDITPSLRGALKPTKGKNHPHLKEDDLPEFLKTLNKYDLEKDDGGYNGNPITKWGFQLLILTFVRTGEIRGAKWDEIDFEKSIWRIPAQRMKMKEQHVVPLSKQAINRAVETFNIKEKQYDSGRVSDPFEIVKGIVYRNYPNLEKRLKEEQKEQDWQ